MQEMTTNAMIPARLSCGGCHHWEETAIRAVPAGEPVGRCGRFGESRLSTSRPRCNICWEPRTLRALEPTADETN
jgi:hypothetical protein